MGFAASLLELNKCLLSLPSKDQRGSICNMPVSSAKRNNRNYLMIQMAFEKVLRSWQELSKGKLKEAFLGEERSQCRRRKGKTVAGNCEETSLNKYRGKMGRKSKTGNVDISPILQGFNSQFEGFLSNFVCKYGSPSINFCVQAE